MENITLPTKMYVRLSQEAREILPELAQADRRYPGQQLDWLVIQEAQRRGLLTNANRASAIRQDSTTGTAAN